MGIEQTKRTGRASWQTLVEHWIPVIIPGIGIIFSEFLLASSGTQYALWGHFITLLLSTMAMLKYKRSLHVLSALALLPVFRISSLNMPIFFESRLGWIVLVYVSILPAIILLSRAMRTVSVHWGSRSALIALPLAAIIALALAEAIYKVVEPTPLISDVNAAQLVVLGAVMVGIVGLTEEFLYRGYLQQTLQGHVGRWQGLLITSLLFGMMHTNAWSGIQIALGCTTGLVLGLVYDVSKSLVLVSLIHGFMNILLFGLLPFYGSIVFT